MPNASALHGCVAWSPPHGMAGIAPSRGNDGSDYGSDFDADDEVILNDLLSRTSDKQNNVPLLVLNDIEDHESPRGARIPRALGREKSQKATPSPRSKNTNKSRISVEVESYRSVSAPGKFECAQSGNAD